MSRKKKPTGPPPPSHRDCALCGNRGVVEGNPLVVDMGRGKGPEKYVQMVRCPGPKTQRELELAAMEAMKPIPPTDPPLSGADRAAGNS